MQLSLIIVDDNKDFTTILHDFLKFYSELEITILGTAHNGLEAIEMITQKQPDVIILDMVMPKLDGIGVLREIKTMQLKKAPRIIFLTAMGSDRLISEALSLGVDYYIEKPFDMDVLISKIKLIKTSIMSGGTD
jgi:two-component system response regulator (stage 0 sporulation protein A)